MYTHTQEKEKKRKAIIYKGLGNETLIYTTTILNFEQIFSLRFCASPVIIYLMIRKKLKSVSYRLTIFRFHIFLRL